MNAVKLSGVFWIVAITIFSTVSCSSDDKVQLEKIIGQWYLDDGEIYFEGPPVYGFGEDNTLSIYVHTGAEYIKSTIGTYIISVMGNPRILTVYDKDKKSIAQYNILMLTNKEMRLESTSKEDENGVLRLLRREHTLNI